MRFGTNKKSLKLLDGVVKGIADYGNCVGVPTIGGDVYFDDTYNHNCLVNVVCLGVVKEKDILHSEIRKRIEVQISEEDIPKFLGSMIQRNIHFLEISIDKPTLEDYFIQMATKDVKDGDKFKTMI